MKISYFCFICLRFLLAPFFSHWPPAITSVETKNWPGPKARAFGTLIIIQLCLVMFPEKIVAFPCSGKKITQIFSEPGGEIL